MNELQRKLEETIESFAGDVDAETGTVSSIWHSVGYHSRVSEGTVVHETRHAVYYALALLDTGDDRRVPAAEKVLLGLMALQETNPYRREFGVWPWLYEEPLDQMAPPDWNWADFIGCGLCHILKGHEQRLSVACAQACRRGLRNAALAIFRRNTQSDYTNIALMGAVVTASAAELLGMDFLRDYALERLRAFERFTKQSGSLAEYNSPCYNFVALREMERVPMVVEDGDIRACAEGIRRLLWSFVLERLEPCCGQLAGPMSRAYQDYLPEAVVTRLNEALGLSMACWPSGDRRERTWDYDPVPRLPCPPEFCQRFDSLKSQERVVRSRFVNRGCASRFLGGYTWLSPGVSLGSISQSSMWVQRRNLLAYWQLAGSSPAVFKVNAMFNGREFDSIGIRNVQERTRVLSLFALMGNGGTYHEELDRPADGCFDVRRLSIRYELKADGATVSQVSDGIYEFSAGDWRVILSLPEGMMFRQVPLTRVDMGGAVGRVWVNIVLLDSEEPIRLCFHDSLGLEVAAAMELCGRHDCPAMERPVLKRGERAHEVRAEWKGLACEGHAVPVDKHSWEPMA